MPHHVCHCYLKYALVSYQTPLVLDTFFLYSKVYVSTTQKNYTQGEFVANLFLQGTFHTSDAKMTGFIKTCENKAYFDQDECPNSMSFSPNEYNILDGCSEKYFSLKFQHRIQKSILCTSTILQQIFEDSRAATW